MTLLGTGVLPLTATLTSGLTLQFTLLNRVLSEAMQTAM